MTVLNFQTAGRLTAATVPRLARERSILQGVYVLRLNGEIGSDKSISLQRAREVLLGAGSFNHLHVQLTSTGGNVAEALSIYELLRAQPCTVSVEAIGQCQSAAMIILMAGSLRLARRDTVLLNHPTSNSRDTLPDRITAKVLAERAASLAETDARIADLFASRTGFPAEWFLAEGSTEEYLSAADAIESGLLHEVDGLPCRVDPAWVRKAKILPQGIHFPAYLLTQNYIAACECAASLYAEDSH